ncbi:MAG: hypothetical protein AAF330_03405 [Pseudomonadota bacterium]
MLSDNPKRVEEPKIEERQLAKENEPADDTDTINKYALWARNEICHAVIEVEFFYREVKTRLRVHPKSFYVLLPR